MSAFRAGDFRVTDHAEMRYRERVKPWLSFPEVKQELAHIIPLGAMRDRPEWASDGSGVERQADEFLFIGDGIAFPVVNGYLLTCITRGTISPQVRERRAAKRKRRKVARAMRERYGFREGRREVAA